MHSVLCVKTIKTLKKLEGEYGCVHTCTEYLTKYTLIGNMEVWKGKFTFYLSYGLILPQVLKTKATTKNAPINSNSIWRLWYIAKTGIQSSSNCLLKMGWWGYVTKLCKTLACHKATLTLGAEPYYNHGTPAPGPRAEGSPSCWGGWEGIKWLSSEPAAAKLGYCCSLSTILGLKAGVTPGLRNHLLLQPWCFCDLYLKTG